MLSRTAKQRSCRQLMLLGYAPGASIELISPTPLLMRWRSAIM
jgi:Fe2+ transport system protein FeoA